MKYYFLTFIFTVICTVFIYGQDNRLIYSKPVSNKAEKSNELLRRKETYSSVDFVEINPEKILEYKQFTLQFADKNISVNKDRIDVRGINSYVFAGSNSEGSNVLLSVLGDDIQGVIETPDGVFDIATIGKKEYAVLKLDYSNLMEDCTNLLEEKNRVDPVDDANHSHTAEIENGNTVSPILKAAAVYGCKIRVLVLYTPTRLPEILQVI